MDSAPDRSDRKSSPCPSDLLFRPPYSYLGGQKNQLSEAFFSWCLNKGHRGGQKLEKAAGDKGIFWALLLFVGIPLPGTGAWTGALAASILDWDFKRSSLAVMLGVILAGLIMGTLSLLLGIDTFAH